MALQFNINVKNVFTSAILLTMGNSNTNFNDSGDTKTAGATIYSGAAPEPDAIIANWAGFNSSNSNYLVHTTIGMRQPGPGPLLALNTGSAQPIVTPINTGTATWAIIWAMSPTVGQLNGTVLPSNKFMVVSVSEPTGDGIIRFLSTALTAGTPVSVQDVTLGVGL